MRLPALILPLIVAGCEAALPVDPIAAPAARPARQNAAEVPARNQSAELEVYYSRVQDGLVSRGLLRTDEGGPDTPFTADDLVRNFERIALFEEYATVGGRIVAAQTESQVHKWVEPVRIEVLIGPAVSDEKAARDRASVEKYAARLSSVSGHPIRVVDDGGNFHVLILTEGERRAFGPSLRNLVPGIGSAAVETVTDMSRQNYCLVFALDRAGRGVYSQAVAVIRAEHPDLLRLSCLQEEIAQGLGLSNDSPLARPSVFNDDEEFGLLTTHDEYLLKMLYDPRIRPGMGAGEAMPLARVIANELVPSS
jgi:hypothetical protein